ncbi:MAG: response regulator [Sorangiineae bacterium]|nr:response regulator [Polyangiaceae bacterium]MEB2323420.1 response regulator [Sorangiineae bacterium]
MVMSEGDDTNRVLVVASEHGTADAVASALGALGFEAHVVSSAEQAFDRLLAQGYRWLLADEGLPGRRGTEVIEAVIRAGASLPCVLLIEDDDLADVDGALASGASFVVRKNTPSWLDELIAVSSLISPPTSGVMRKAEAVEPLGRTLTTRR